MFCIKLQNKHHHLFKQIKKEEEPALHKSFDSTTINEFIMDIKI